MILTISRTALAVAAAALLLPATCSPAQKKPAKASAKAAAPCSLLTPDEIKSVINEPVLPGTSGSNDCTWKDAKGEDRVYLSVRSSDDWHNLHDTMRGTGHLTPLTGIAEDAFFVSSSGSSAALYLLKHRRYVILTITGPNYSRAENEGAEKALAPEILKRL